MAKKPTKKALQEKSTLSKVDFYLYKPDPRDPSSLRAVPKEKGFRKEKQGVTFFNDNGDPIRVHFQAPLRVDPKKNPLKINPGQERSVTIDPLAYGDFPCIVEILASICPTCDSALAGKHVLSLRPDGRLAVDLPGHSTVLVDDDEADEDPIIKIKPEPEQG